jgi:hypothetical protein
MKQWKDINDWSIKGPIFVAALLLGFFDHALHWGRASFVAGLALIVPMIGFREYWNQAKFWITVALLGAIQVLLVLGVSSMMEQLKFPFMLAFGIADSVLIALTISRVCSEHDGGGA